MQLSEQSSTTTSGLNLSLFKLGPVVHVTIGATVAAMVVVAATVTVAVVVQRSNYNFPTLKDDTITTYKRTPIRVFVLQNDKDERDANLTVIGVKQPPFGKVEINGGQYVTFSPFNMDVVSEKFAGTFNFTYEAMNDKLASEANVTVTILNRVPEPVNLVYVGSKNSKDNVIKVFEDKDQAGLQTLDIDLDVLHVESITQPQFGVARISEDKQTVLYTPNYNFKSVDTFTYTVSDKNDTASAKITFTINNNPPRAVPDVKRAPKNKIVANLTLLENDFDINGDEITITRLGNNGIGFSFITNNGTSVDYYPANIGSYGDSFEYTITDGDLFSSSFATITLFNSAPVAQNVVLNVGKNSINNVVPLTFSDPDPYETLVVTVGPSTGSKVLSNTTELVDDAFLTIDNMIKWQKNTWTLLYTPTQGFIGTDIFTYTVSDSDARNPLSGTAQVTINVINQPPVAVNDNAQCSKNKDVLVDAIANDSDPNGDSIEYVRVDATSQNGGSVSIVNGKIKYVPASNFVGTDTFNYVITDIQSNRALDLQATGTVTINVINDAPVAVDDTYTVPRGQTTQLSVRTNDVDPNGDAINIDFTDATSSSGVSLSFTTTVAYSALSGSPYVDTFQYSVSDGSLTSNKARVTVNVINVAPVANPDAATIHMNNIATISVLTNDNDPNPSDTPLLTILSVTQPANGTVTISSDLKTVTYTPNNFFVGRNTFTYICQDIFGAQSNIATVTVDVTNNAPVANPDSYTLLWGRSGEFNIIGNDTDPDSDTISLVSVSKGSIVSGRLSYTAGSTLGNDIFTYVITDGQKQSTGQVTINIIDNAPTTQNDTATVHWNSNGVQINVLDNDSDIDGDPLTITNPSTPSSGSITNQGSSLTYIPSKTFIGEATFSYLASDTVLTTRGFVRVTITNQNQPTSAPQTFNVHWRTNTTQVNVLSSRTDDDGDVLTISSSSPSNGVVSQQVDGTTGIPNFIFSQTQNFVGTGSFNYGVSDGISQSSLSTITINVFNNPPVAQSYTFNIAYTIATQGYSINVINDATDPNSADVPFLFVSSNSQASPSVGTVSLDSSKKILTYTHSNVAGGQSVTFTYVVNDGLSNSNTATIRLNIGLPPAAGNIERLYTSHWRTARSGLSRYISIGSPNATYNGKLQYLTGILHNNPSFGTVTFGPTETIDSTPQIYRLIYTPSLGFIGTDDIVAQTNGGNATVTFVITNTPPTASPLTRTTHWRTSQNFDILAASTDVDTDPLQFQSLGSTTPINCGSRSWNSVSKIVSFTPSATTGTCQFTYSVNDTIQTASSTITVTITNGNPVTTTKFGYIHWTVHRDGYNVTNLLQGDTDPNNDPITLSSVGTANPSSAGTVIRVNNGLRLTALQPSTFVNNNVTIPYVITDTVGTATGLVNVYVFNRNPVAVDDSYSVVGSNPQTSFDYNVLLNDSDPDVQDTISIRAIISQGLGTASIFNNRIRYTPPAKFIGRDTVTYTVTDGMGTSNTATVTFNINNQNPVGVPDFYSVHWRSTITINPLANDFDPENNTPFSFSLLTNPSAGTLNNMVYTPSTSQTYSSTQGSFRVRNDTFTYTVMDSYDRTGTGSITITIRNTPPVANPDSLTFAKTPSPITRTVSVLVNDTDADNDPIQINSVSYTSGNGAIVSIVGNNIQYIPSNNFRNGIDWVTYTINDGQLVSNPTNVTFIVTNQAPTTNGFSQTVNKLVSYTWDLATLGTPSDPNGDSLTYQLDPSNPTDKGTLTISGSQVTFISKPNRSGLIQFRYRVSDGILTSAYATINVTIVNNPPTAVNDFYSFVNSPRTIRTWTVMDNDFDNDGDSITVIAVTQPTPSGAGSNSFRSLNVTHNATIGWTQPSSFLYTIRDSDIDSPLTSVGNVSISVTSNLPQARDDLFTTEFNTNIDIPITSLLSNDLSPTGAQGVGIQFDSTGFATDMCNSGNKDYCVNNQKPFLNVPSNGIIRVPFFTNSCKENKFQYCIFTIGDPSSKQCATVTVRYVNCICTAAIDLTFVLDSSGSITAANWRFLMDFLERLITSLDNQRSISATGINIGIVQYGTEVRNVQTLTSSVSTTLSNINWLRSNHMSQSTATKAGLQRGLTNVQATTRTVNGVPPAKVIAVLTDGVAIHPCECYVGRTLQPCICHGCGTNGTDLLGTRYCSYSPPRQFCQDCANPIPLAREINSYRAGVNGRTSNFKVVSVGLGDQLTFWNSFGWRQVQSMNFDPPATIAASFETLDAVRQQLVDASCNI